MKNLFLSIQNKIQRKLLKRHFKSQLARFQEWLENQGNLTSYSQYQQDLFVKYYYDKNPRKNLFFVDIGANDGIALSNTLALEQDSKWGGVY